MGEGINIFMGEVLCSSIDASEKGHVTVCRMADIGGSIGVPIGGDICDSIRDLMGEDICVSLCVFITGGILLAESTRPTVLRS